MPLFKRRTVIRPRKRSARIWLLWFLLLLVLAVSAAVHPDSGRLLVRVVEWALNRRADVSVSVNDVSGALVDGVILQDVRIKSAIPGAKADLQIERLDLTFALRFFEKGGWLATDLYLLRPKGRIQQSREALPGRDELIFLRARNLQIREGDLVIRRGDTAVELHDFNMFSPLDRTGIAWAHSGELAFPTLRLDLPPGKAWVDRSTTGIGFTNLMLAKGLELSEIRLDVPDGERREATLSVVLLGFGGMIRVQAYAHETTGGLQGSFATMASNISLGSISEFFGQSSAREGVIEEAKLSFQGSLADPVAANASLTAQIRDLVWQDRRWKSFRLGAVYFNRRVELTDFQLIQMSNELRLKGTLDVGSGFGLFGMAPRRFDLNVKADLNDLGEFTRLLWSAPPPCSGTLSVVGNLKGADNGISGELAVSGSKMVLNGAPVEELATKLKFQGEEVEVSELYASNEKDYVKGTGNFQLTGERRYAGSLESSIAEAGLYAPALGNLFLAKMKGALKLKWNGDGTKAAHSGTFAGAFDKARFFNAGEAESEGVVEGSYSPGNLAVNKIEVRDKETELTAALSASPEGVKLRSIKVAHLGETWLEGSAHLPLDYWKMQRGRPLSEVVLEEGQTDIQLKSAGLRLDTIAKLLRAPFPIGGKLDFEVKGNGAIDDLNLDFLGKVEDLTFGTDNPPATLQLSGSYFAGAARFDGQLVAKEGKPVEWTALIPIELTERALRLGRVFRANRPLVASVDFPDFPVTWLDLAYPGLKVRGGKLSGRLSISGTAAQPGFFGSIEGSDLFVSGAGFLPPAWGLQTRVNFFKDEISVEKFAADTVQGHVESSGSFRLGDEFTTVAPVRILLRDWDIWSGMWGEMHGDGDLAWELLPDGYGFLSGKFEARRLRLDSDLDFVATEPLDPAKITLDRPLSMTSLDVNVTAEASVGVLPIEKMNLRLFGPATDLRIFGDCEFVGLDCKLEGRHCRFETGRVEFVGTPSQVLLSGKGDFVVEHMGFQIDEPSLFAIDFGGRPPVSTEFNWTPSSSVTLDRQWGTELGGGWSLD